MKKFILKPILIVILVGLLPVSCCLTDSCGCGSTEQTTVKVDGINIQSINKAFETLDNNTAYNYTNYFKEIELSLSKVASINRNSHFSLYSNAMACEPPPPLITNGIVRIQVFANNTFNLVSEMETINQGDDISNYFGINDSQVDPLSFEEFLEGEQGYLWYSPTLFVQLVLTPYQNTDMDLNFKIELSDGTVFEIDERMKVLI